MSAKLPFSLLICICFFSAPLLRAQNDPSSDTDLTKMLKEAQDMQKEAEEMQKTSPTAPGKKKTMAELEAESKAEMSRMEAQEKKEKAELQAALKKQLAEPSPAVLPEWTPKTPQFTITGPAAKRIVDDEVKIIQTGTSTIAPKEIADGWEAAATAAGNLNHVRNSITSNGNVSMIMFLSTRTDPVQKVEMDARRAPDEKITRIEISSPLPKPEIPGD